MRDSFDFGVVGCHGVVGVCLEDPPGVRPDEMAFHSSEVVLSVEEAKEDRFKPCRPRIVLLVWIRRRSDDRVDGCRLQEAVQFSGVGQVDGTMSSVVDSEHCQVASHSLDSRHPCFYNGGVDLGRPNTYFGSEMEVANV